MVTDSWITHLSALTSWILARVCRSVKMSISESSVRLDQLPDLEVNLFKTQISSWSDVVELIYFNALLHFFNCKLWNKQLLLAFREQCQFQYIQIPRGTRAEQNRTHTLSHCYQCGPRHRKPHRTASITARLRQPTAQIQVGKWRWWADGRYLRGSS